MDAFDHDFAVQIKSQATELGFVLNGITTAVAPGRLDAFHRWLEAGFHGTMHYLETRRDAYSHPRYVMEGCRSIVMLGFPYWHRDLEAEHPNTTTGKVARYAAAESDYHDIIHAKLKSLRRWVQDQSPDCQVRGVVDTAPLLEREFAELAGLGWIGKNTLLLNRKFGSYFFLAALLLDRELPADDPFPQSYCGTCTACLDQCPTKAFPQAFVLDATKCISYLTIEHRDAIEPEIAERFDGWLFGCDVCQEVCPWNRKGEPTDNEITMAEKTTLSPSELLELDDDAFRHQFRKTPLWRPRRRGLLRNALLSLASSTNELSGAARSRCQKLLHDEEPLLRMTAAWTLKHKQVPAWDEFIRDAVETEEADDVRTYLKSLIRDH